MVKDRKVWDGKKPNGKRLPTSKKKATPLRSFPGIALRIISHAISTRVLENGGFFFTAGPRHGNKSSFLRKRVRLAFFLFC